MNSTVAKTRTILEDPPIAKALFGDTRLAWLWLPIRIYLGYSWLTSGIAKLQNPGWLNTGEALRDFWINAVRVDPKPVIATDWYRGFIQWMLDTQAYTWFAKVVVLGELTIGIALILGAFTGLAAFTGGFLNWNFVMAGTASSNALLFAIATWLVLAWKTAGWIGLDRWLLNALGTPWRPGRLLTHDQASAASATVEEAPMTRPRTSPTAPTA
jgi:thiosulfate dehydrogenase [quinone] large subunit